MTAKDISAQYEGLHETRYPDELPVVMFDTPEHPTPPANLAARANERIRRLEAGRAHLLKISDAPGNWLDELDVWFGSLPYWKQIIVVFAAVLACCFAAGVVVGFAR